MQQSAHHAPGVRGSRVTVPPTMRFVRLHAIALVFTAAGCGEPAPDFDPALGAQLQTALEAGTRDYSCWGITAAAIIPGKGTWRGAAGRDDISLNTPMPADGIFRIGSITKTFVATVFLQLEAE